MRAILSAVLLTCSISATALCDEAASASQSAAAPSTGAAADTSRSARVAQYPAELADRPIAIGADRYEVSFQGSGQLSSALGFGLIPELRWGYSDSLELTLLGVRYIVTEDGSYIPGLALSAKLHDLSYQHNTTLNTNYPALRPSFFVELRDRLPFHLAVNGRAGYQFEIQSGSTAPDGTPIQDSQRVPVASAPFEVQLQYSPLSRVSFVGAAGFLWDLATPPLATNTQSDGYFSVAAVYNSSRFDVRVFFQNNWFTNPALGDVPEVGASVAVRL